MPPRASSSATSPEVKPRSDDTYFPLTASPVVSTLVLPAVPESAPVAESSVPRSTTSEQVSSANPHVLSPIEVPTPTVDHSAPTVEAVPTVDAVPTVETIPTVEAVPTVEVVPSLEVASIVEAASETANSEAQPEAATTTSLEGHHATVETMETVDTTKSKFVIVRLRSRLTDLHKA